VTFWVFNRLIAYLKGKIKAFIPVFYIGKLIKPSRIRQIEKYRTSVFIFTQITLLTKDNLLLVQKTKFNIVSRTPHKISNQDIFSAMN